MSRKASAIYFGVVFALGLWLYHAEPIPSRFWSGAAFACCMCWASNIVERFMGWRR